MMDRVIGTMAGIVFFVFLEAIIYRLGKRYGKSLATSTYRELVSRLTELVAAILIVASGVSLSYYYLKNGLNEITANFAFARWHAILMLSFFIYHAARVLVIQGYLRSLLVHHALMIVGLSYCLISDLFYFYPAIISLQSLAAVLRNYGWLSLRMDFLPLLPRRFKKAAYIFVENVLTLSYLIYFLGWGMHVAEIPWHGWAVGFVIAVTLLALTLYWTLQFLQNGGAAKATTETPCRADASAA